jgi:F1F0 ATPase subunit 2
VAGLIFFGGLRWTVDRIADSRKPVLLAVGSFIVRGLAVAGLVVAVADGSLLRVLAALVGILGVRTLLVSITRRELEGEEAQWT